jgi:hypothetical protein
MRQVRETASFAAGLVLNAPALADKDARRACELMRSQIAQTAEIAADVIFISGFFHAGLLEPLKRASQNAPDAIVVNSPAAMALEPTCAPSVMPCNSIAAML